ncbi:MAG: tRNA (5-methylaminomethyl-2-thiouridine)(34)-methyltransferase MnmD [Polaribacter sp.]|nr:tRNA (5-methylaminomethyl-2-thiouridine)(34)-methyltransferase MnmD [Polaribacter sp.]
MKREIRITSDGSATIHLPDWNEQYHSKHGAIQEAYHVFIKYGLEAVLIPKISILEIGFGTALNCFITLLEAQKRNLVISYVGVEAYPVTEEEVLKLNYVSELKAVEKKSVFETMHQCSWEEKKEISFNFHLHKRQQFFQDINDKNEFDLVYFDAFGAEHQPHLWTTIIFEKMFNALKINGILVTYSAKGSVRRALQEVGFDVERLPGPPGKREMLRATKVMK